MASLNPSGEMIAPETEKVVATGASIAFMFWTKSQVLLNTRGA